MEFLAAMGAIIVGMLLLWPYFAALGVWSIGQWYFYDEAGILWALEFEDENEE